MQNQKMVDSNQSNARNMFETYEILIAQNLLNQFHLNLELPELEKALKDKKSIYSILLNVPMQNSFNGMILSQIETYKQFCQKRLADYIISTNPTREEQASPDFEEIIPDDIERYKQALINLQNDLRTVEQDYYDGIAKTQAYLIKVVNFEIINQGVFSGNYTKDILEFINEKAIEAQQTRTKLVQLRQEWEKMSSDVCVLLADKSGYLIDENADLAQRSELNFLKNLGIQIENS